MAEEAQTLATRLAAAAREAGGMRRADAPTLPGHSAVLLDAYPLWHEAVELVLQRLEIAVVGRHAVPDDALATIERHAPDLLVTDLEFEAVDGPAFLRRARTRHPGLRIVVLTLADEPERVQAALTAGADAYVVKAAHPEDLATAVRQCFAHSLYLAAPLEGRAGAAAPLTPREVEILRLVAEGYSNRRLAELLAVSEPTVKFHLTNVYRKLGVANRTEASRWAQRQGLLGAATRRVRS